MEYYVGGDQSLVALFLGSNIAGESVQVNTCQCTLQGREALGKPTKYYSSEDVALPAVAIPGLPVGLKNTFLSGQTTAVYAPFKTM